MNSPGGLEAPRLFDESVTDPQLRERYRRAAVEANCSVQEMYQLLGHVEKCDLLQSFASFHGVQGMGFSESVAPPQGLLKSLNRDYLLQRRAVPVGEENGRAVVLMENPRDVVTRDDLSIRMGGRPLTVRVGIREDIEAFIDLFYGTGPRASRQAPTLTDLREILDSLEGEGAATAAKAEEEESNENEAGVVRLVNQLIDDAAAKGASDLHLEPDPEGELTVRFRIDGICQEHARIPRRYARAVASRVKIMCGLDIAERRLPQDGKIKYRGARKTLELRVATMPTQGGYEDMVLRLLASSKPVALASLGMRAENLDRFKKALAAAYGLILCVGPTGSGKTTTLHSALAHLNTPERKIWTAEDPVEITQKGVRQVQVQAKIGFTFARALRGFLRCDPNVIMVGEMRDPETAAIAVEASLTGHLVLSTLHTNSAAETVTRLLDMELDPFSFGDSLLAVLAQRLLRTLCTACRKPVAASPRDVEVLEREFGGPLPAEPKPASAAGCGECGGKGYRGRAGIHELMIVDEAIRLMVYRKAKAHDIKQQALAAGMWTHKQEGIRRALAGETDLREVRRVTNG